MSRFKTPTPTPTLTLIPTLTLTPTLTQVTAVAEVAQAAGECGAMGADAAAAEGASEGARRYSLSSTRFVGAEHTVHLCACVCVAGGGRPTHCADSTLCPRSCSLMTTPSRWAASACGSRSSGTRPRGNGAMRRSRYTSSPGPHLVRDPSSHPHSVYPNQAAQLLDDAMADA